MAGRRHLAAGESRAEYTVTLSAGGTTLRQPLTVRMDPRINASESDMQAWHREASIIEHTECSLGRRSPIWQPWSVRRESRDPGRKADADSILSQLRPIALALRGDPRDPGHVNLPGRLNWLTIQVGNNSGRPTAAQSEWIRTYAAEAEAVIKKLASLKPPSASR